ncbi:hypothetical protein ABT030_03140 [Streptomyces mirabilis]|uniref:hypothetical protein n=1 Tax=Streptomyces mirabilis TaxID=68239 RepID=UPI00332A40BB
MTTSPPIPSAPSWPYCAHGADPVGCRGINVSGHTDCLTHLADTDRNAYLTSLSPALTLITAARPSTKT